MKKIGIITLVGYFNYGNRLQNYALQKIIEDLGYSVETIYVERETNKLKRFLKRFLKGKNGRYHLDLVEAKREQAFRNFTKKYIKTKVLYFKDNCIPKDIDSNYDFFVVGSDQVWNPTFWDGDMSHYNNYMLMFANEKKRVSYAASIGVSQLPEEWNNLFKKSINTFCKVSVREREAADLINKLVNAEVKVVLDPTMLVDKNHWSKLGRTNHKVNIKKPYMLVMFLGDISESVANYIERIHSEYKLDIINIMDTSTNYYFLDPRGFLELIEKASFVVTDSFHATVFSIIFNIPFVVLDRKQSSFRGRTMNSRIMTLLETFHLEARYEMVEVQQAMHIDFNDANKILEVQKKESLKFLKSSLVEL